MDDDEDISESSSVRMERELLDTHTHTGKDPETMKYHTTTSSSSDMSVGDTTNNTGTATAVEGSSSSSLNEFDLEIQRLTRDADKILDSIRQEVHGSDTTTTTTKSNTKKKKKTSLTAMNERPDDSTKNKSTSNSNPGSDQSEIAELSSPSSVVTTDVDDDYYNNDQDCNYDEDDEMSDEIERLDSVTAAIRQSLDAKGDTTIPTLSSSPSSPAVKVHSTSIPIPTHLEKECLTLTMSSMDETRSSLVVMDTSTKNRSTSSTGSSSMNREGKNDDLAVVVERAGSSVVLANTSSTQASLTAAPHDTIQKDDPYLAAEEQSKGYYESVLLAITVVWALVLFLLIHAKYSLLDENGVVRLPFPFG